MVVYRRLWPRGGCSAGEIVYSGVSGGPWV